MKKRPQLPPPLPELSEIGAPAFSAPWHAAEFSGWRIVLLRHFITQNSCPGLQIVLSNGPHTVYAEGVDDADLWKQVGKNLPQK